MPALAAHRAFTLLSLFALCACAPEAGTAPADYRGPIIDTHAHLRLADDDAASPAHSKGTAELLKLDQAAGVTHSALIVMARKGQLERMRSENDAVIAASAESRGHFYPVVSVHPADGAAALAELERVARAGAKVVKLHPNTQAFDVSDPEVATIVQKCGELGLVVLFDSYKPWDPGEMGKLLLLSLQQPKTRFVLAHMGFSQFREVLSFALVNKLGMGGNVWFDVSALATTYVDSPLEAELVWTMRKIGIEKVLFGSDWPVDTPAVAAEAVRHLGLTPGEQKRVLHDNAAELLGL
jgi:predicted TIM-barrel fold metal-dependent hydrolase